MNNAMTLKENLLFLNLILRHEVDRDWDYEGMIYIAVDYARTKNLIQQLICDDEAFNNYVEDFKENETIDCEATIDICVLWGDVCSKFEVDIWYNAKLNKFYVVKWYHLLYSKYSATKRSIKDWIRNNKQLLRINIFNFKHGRATRKRLKKLSKQYSGVDFNE